MDRQNKILDWLELVSSTIFVVLLVVVLWFSLKYWTSRFPEIIEFNSKIYSIAILIAVVTVLAEWLNGRIKAIVKGIQRIKRKKGVCKYD